MKTIADLDPKESLGGIRVKTPKGVVGYWKSQWQAGVWLSDGKSSQIYPQFVDSLKDCLTWEITDEEVNCHILTDMKYTDNAIEEIESK